MTQTLQNYLKVSVGNDTYNLTKYDKIQLIDVTEIRSPITGHDLLSKWRIKIIHKNNGAKARNFLKYTVLVLRQFIHAQQLCLLFGQRLCISKLYQTVTIMN